MQKHDETDAKGRELNNVGACAPDVEMAAEPLTKSDDVDLEAKDAAEATNKSERGGAEASPESDNLPVSGERLSSIVDAKEE